MNRLRIYLQGLSFSERSAPAAFLLACLLGFGLLIPFLGFYMDDWPYVFYANTGGPQGLQTMLTYDTRPNAAWLYILGFNLFGSRPLAWHISSLLMRWATVVFAWLVFRELWPQRKTEAIGVSLLFAVYPFFMLQPFAVGSTHHWFGFMTFTLSLFLMIRSTQVSSWRQGLCILLAVILAAAHLFTSEYFAGLELLRLPILWLLAARLETGYLKRTYRTLLQWLPYVCVLLLFVYWRTVIYENPPGIVRNQPVVLQQLSNEPLKALNYLAGTSFRDSLSVILIGWQKATDVSLLSFSSPWSIFRLAICLFSLGLAYFYLTKLSVTSSDRRDDWPWTSLGLAVIGLAAGGLPIWLIGRSIGESNNLLSASRFGIPSMLGAALLFFVVLDSLITDRKRKWIALSVLLALAVNFHLENTKQFQYSWEKQVRFSQELLWRAPMLQPGTTIFTDEEVLGLMGEYAVSFSIITTYQPETIETPPYWYFPFYYSYPNVDDLLAGIPVEGRKLTMLFTGDSRNMILLSFNPEMRRCLWVLQPQDINLRLVSSDMRRLSEGSNISLITETPGADPSLPENIYGQQDTHTWCYYFEKADLARQYENWAEIKRLWEQASSEGLQADNGFEYIPFIEGYGHLENWEQVRTLTRHAKKITAGLEPSLCSALDRLAADAPRSALRDETIDGLKSDLKCVDYQ
jgi:hypothetical protein